MVDRPWSTTRSPVVHHWAAVVQGAELVEGGEGGSSVGGLIAKGAVELGGVTDRFMDGEEKVARVDDDVVAARLDRGRGDVLGEMLGELGDLGVEVVAGAGEVFPAPSDGRSERSH